jgi:hypothetical protein
MTWLVGLGIKLLGFGKWLREALGALLKWALANPWQTGVIALCAFSGWLWRHDSRIISGKDQAIASQAATIKTKQATIDQMTAASAANLKAQLAQKAAVEQHYKDLANDADTKHAEQLADANDVLSRYIASHRVRTATADSGFSPASGSAEGGSAQSSIGPGSEADLVTVTPDDLKICTVNTTRLQVAHDWAMQLGK